ncbi:MAG TPA: DAK2 domain-containing protein, partial [Acidimicrobiales bacterium]|nr:DAK2 domain-containing protein [Acidimicrobiales bacterium]
DGAVEAAGAALESGAGAHELLMAAAEQWSDRAGGSSGALWSAALMAMGASLGNRGSYDASDLVASAVSARDAMAELGNAAPGDKTVLDAVYPFVEVLQTEIDKGRPAGESLRAAAEASTRAAAGTAPMRPRKGRARPLAERSVGHPDPGAVSFALIVTALAANVDAWADTWGATWADNSRHGAAVPEDA